MGKFLFIFLFLLASLPIYCKTVEDIAHSPKWLKLVHYRPSLIFPHQSTLTNEFFFISKEGRTDPLQELIATIELLKKNPSQYGRFQKPARCVFVERFDFLKKVGLIDKNLKQNCPEFEEWKEGMGTDSITVIFSSYYPNNPSSMFGHTFLRFHNHKTKNKLLDYGAAYEAFVPPHVNFMVYATKGLLGGFLGYFQFSPYYQMVERYSGFENRDLYEYHLNIDKDGVNSIVGHLWELYSTGFTPYYFLDRNCSFILGELIEVAKPQWDLSQSNFLYYHPGRLILNLEKTQDAISSVDYLPSLKKRFQFELSGLDKNEKELFLKLQRQKIKAENTNNKKVLNVLISYYNLFRHRKKLSVSAQHEKKYQKLLRYRSTLGLAPTTKKSSIQRDFPELSHGYSNVELGLSYQHYLAKTLTYSLCNLNLLGNDLGLPQTSTLQSGILTLKYNKNKLLLDHLTLLKIESLHLYTFYDPQFSWLISGEYTSIPENIEQHSFNLDFGWGIGGGANNLFASILSGLSFEISKNFSKDRRTSIFLKSNFVFDPDNAYKLVLEGKIKRTSNNTSQAIIKLGQSYSLKKGKELSLKHKIVYTSLTHEWKELLSSLHYIVYF